MSSRFLLAALASLALLAAPQAARAQEAQPGDACPTANHTRWAGGIETGGKGYYMTCQGGVWVRMIESDTGGNIGVKKAAPKAPLHVGGEAIIGETTGLPCDADRAGALRYSSAGVGSIEFCNGASWQNIGSAGGSIDALSDGKTDYATDFNLFMGQDAGAAIAAGGRYNLFIGQSAGDSVTTGYHNIAIGPGALEDNITGINNVAIGRWSLGTNTAHYNTAVGYAALIRMNTGSSNTAVGNSALSEVIGGSSNTGLGNEAGFYATGSYNTFVGSHSGYRWTTGDNNTVVGQGSAMQGSVSGSNNVLLGTDIAKPASSTTFSNVVILGASAGTVSDGDNNIFIGYQAGNSVTTGASNILIGYDVDAPTASTSNHLNIGDTIYGDMSADTLTVGTTAGQVRALPPPAEIIGAGATVTADACGTIKRITATVPRTTNTTNTFTTPAAANAGCCMDIVNTGANDITLDANANFKTLAGADQVLGQHDIVRVCSEGALWYQAGPLAANQ